jgi:hypothetical protein
MENKVVNLEVQSNLDATEKSLGSLKSQLRQAQNEVTALSEKFGATSREAVNAAKKAGELKDRISDAKALTDAFNPDAKFKALTASLSGVAGGFAAYQGALGLVGIESKDLERQLLKVQSAMAISQGLQSVGESIDSFKQLGAVIKNTSVAQKVLSATTAAYTFVTGAATTGLKLFRAALIGTGIGAIVVGLGLLIANFDKVKNAVLNVIPGLKSVGEFFGSIVNEVTDFVGATSDATRALDKLKTDADNTLKVNKKFLDEHGSQLDEYTKKKIDAKNAYAEAIKEDGANQIELAKELNRKLAAIEFSRGDEKRKIQKDANDKAIEEKKANDKKLIEDKKAEDKKYSEETKIGLDELRKVNFDNNVNISSEKRGLLDEQIALLEEGVAAVQESETATTNEAKEQTIARIALITAEMKAKLEAADAVANTLSAMGDLLGKETAAGKAAAVASATINTFSSAQKAYDATVGIPYVGPILAPINAGIAIAAGIKNVKSILAVKVPGGGGGGSAPMGNAAQAGTTAPQFNVVGNSGANQLAQTLGREQPPIKAYVTASDVSTGQSLNRNIITNASLG